MTLKRTRELKLNLLITLLLMSTIVEDLQNVRAI